MSGIGDINLKVLVMDTDFYALQAINGYLAWDRRTRVICLAESPEQMWSFVLESHPTELPDVVVIDADHFTPTELHNTISRLRDKIEDLMVVCLAQFVNPTLVEVAADSHARAYFLKHEVRLQVASAICFALEHDFVVTSKIARDCEGIFHRRFFDAIILPEQREYPELTDRIRQAVKLCVIEGMPAHLAADEMGISLHTIRGYIKEGYRILESYDENEYPTSMTPQERAFMRFTALDIDKEDEESGQLSD